jgi:2-oxoacid:acceptor oxidoreductase gamma subunit (pyruvate/2-ketoisovalerate family)
MFRIRFHGRGGQGMKTASRILGSAFFLAGYEVQDAPRYGAERRGAPIFAYVRADHCAINERGIIRHPDLVVVADDTLVGMPAAGVTEGVNENTLLLINSHESARTWARRLNTRARILILTAKDEVEDRAELPYIGSRCAAAAAVLCGVISRDLLLAALNEELAHLPDEVVKKNRDTAVDVFENMAGEIGLVSQGGQQTANDYVRPAWITLPFESGDFKSRRSRRRYQRPGSNRPLAHHAACYRLRQMQRLLVDMQHLLPRRHDRRRRRRIPANRLPALQGLPGVRRAMSAACDRIDIRAACTRAGKRGGFMTRKLVTGNSAAAWGARLAGVDYIPAFPITPQTEIIEDLAAWIDRGEMDARLVTLESEHSMITAAGSAASSGVRAFTATSSQGLLYGMEMIYTVAGWRTPFVLVNVSRGLASPITLESDHNDIMAARDSGFVQIHCATCQEIADGVLLAYRLAEHPQVRVPAIVNLDGFYLSFTREPVDLADASKAPAQPGDGRAGRRPLLLFSIPGASCATAGTGGVRRNRR